MDAMQLYKLTLDGSMRLSERNKFKEQKKTLYTMWCFRINKKKRTILGDGVKKIGK